MALMITGVPSSIASAAKKSSSSSTNSSGQQINAAGNVIGGAVTKSGQLSYDGVNAIGGTGKYVDNNLNGNQSTGAIAPITTNDLTPTTPVKLPTAPTTQNYSGLLSEIGSQYSIKQDGTQTDTSGLSSIADFINQNAPKQESGLQAYEDTYGVSARQVQNDAKAAQARVTSLTNQVSSINATAQAQILNEIGQGRGIPEAIIGGRQAQISKEAAIRVLPLAAELSSSQNDLATAQKHLDRLFDIKATDLKNEYDYKTNVFKSILSLATTAEQRQIDANIKAEDRTYEKGLAFDADKKSYMMEALKDKNYSLFYKLNEANTQEEISKAVIGSVVPAGGKTKAATIAESIFNGTSNLNIKSLPIGDRAAVDAELNILKREALSSGDIYGIIRASAGGDATSDTFNNSFEKALNVAGQLGELQTVVEGKTTGPIVGIVTSRNPYDTKAKLIKAQLQSIVPNLARGVYGEVGVLTDNDVDLYAKTLANLSTTEDANEAIMGFTLRTVQRSLENKIKVAAGLGKDVSGILETYRGVREAADAQLARPIEKAAEATLATYAQKNPAAASDIQEKMKAAEKAIGRNISYTEFLQSYPEFNI